MWTFSNPVEIRFGVGALESVHHVIASRPYCLVTYNEPSFDRIAQQLALSAGQPALVINNISPNPDFPTLTTSCNILMNAEMTPELIVAIGGGSVIDAAKVLASGAGGFQPVRTFLETGSGEDQLSAIPIIAVPTTAGTGSEVTSWATVWDAGNNKKYSLARPELYATHAIIDPELMAGMPRSLTITTALDALSHALESIWNVNNNPISTEYAVSASRIILQWLPRLVDDLENLEHREYIARAALFAGLAFSNTRTALAHSLSYPITLQHNVPHGLACSFSLPMIMRAVIGQSEDCDAGLKAIFGDDLQAGADRLQVFMTELGVSVDKTDYGVSVDEWEQLIDDALSGERGRNFIGTRENMGPLFA